MASPKQIFDSLVLQRMVEVQSNSHPKVTREGPHWVGRGVGNDGRQYVIKVHKESGRVIENLLSKFPVRPPRDPISINHSYPSLGTNNPYWTR